MVAQRDYSQEIAWEFFDDIPSLSNIAAMELSDLINNRPPFETKGLEKLAMKIYDSILHEDSLDRTAVVIMNMAFDDAKLCSKADTVEDLIKNADQVHQRLEGIISNPIAIKDQKPQELSTMRDFCRKLYERASALESSIYDIEPWHPFRR